MISRLTSRPRRGGAGVKETFLLEQTWNDDNGATGGGISEVFPIPNFQASAGDLHSANPGGHQGRGVPDISGYASGLGGYTTVVYGAPLPGNGGTSATAPLYAGLIAVINAVLGKSVGYLNPFLYNPRCSGGVVVDINDGISNFWKCGPVATPSYKAGPGWDACTGLGRINGHRLLAALRNWI
jgi:kumamolisin